MMPIINKAYILTVKLRRLLALLPILCWGFLVHGQEISWKADRNSILIGQPITFRLEMPLPADDASFSLTLPDSIPHFELVRAPDEAQSAKKNYIREWVFTSFDSGSWVLPSFPVLLRQGGNEKTLYTDSVLVDVMYDPADSTGTLRDIKPVIDVPVPDYTWYYIAAGILLLALLCWVIYWFYFRQKKSGLETGDSRLSAFDELLHSLDALSTQPLESRANHVAWHAAMSDMVRRYASRRSGKNRMSATTGELLLDWGREGLGADGLSVMADILRTGDAVKFARYEPSAETTRQAVARLREVAKMIEQLKTGN